MFGYITINAPELKIRDYQAYHSFYCGMCRSLKTKYGRFGQLALNYDLTFLAMLLTGLYAVSYTHLDVYKRQIL